MLLVDLDLGASNLHTFLALGKPQMSLKQYLNKEVRDINDVVMQTSQPNLSVISSSGCSLEIANLYYAQKVKLIRAIKKLSYDYLFIDLGSGTHYNTLDFYLISNEGIIITTPAQPEKASFAGESRVSPFFSVDSPVIRMSGNTRVS